MNEPRPVVYLARHGETVQPAIQLWNDTNHVSS